MATAYRNFSVHVLSEADFAAIEEAAKRQGMKRSTFVFQAAARAAQQALRKTTKRKAA